MMLIGLTGGVATGKSTVARLFAECGAQVIDADLLARQVVAPGKPAWRDIVQVFGPSILHPDRTLDRAALGKLVFGQPRLLRKLERIIHPRVAREQARLTRAIAQRDPEAVVIYDAPVLIEADAHRRMDRLIVVTTDQSTQIARLAARNGFSRAEALRRIHAQWPLAKKVAMADDVLDGRLPIRQLKATVRTLWQSLRHETPPRRSGRKTGRSTHAGRKPSGLTAK